MQELVSAVIIDDNEKDILDLSTALATRGIAVFPIHYKDGDKPIEMCKKIAEVASPRIIFTDIQLREIGPDPTAADYSLVANCLQKLVSNTDGPYAILAWSSKTDSFDKLKERVEAYFQKTRTSPPVYFDRICKDLCRPKGKGGDICVETTLQKFSAHLEIDKQLRALLHWEGSALKAAKETVNALVKVPGDLGDSMYSLGLNVAGKNLKNNEAIAVNEALSFVLKDQLAQNTFKENAKDIWKDALENKKPASKSGHILNSLLHIDETPNAEIICPGDVWIINEPKDFLLYVCPSDEVNSQYAKFKEEFIVLTDKGYALQSKYMKAKKPSYKKELKAQLKIYTDSQKHIKETMKAVAIEVSPVCDFSNNKKPLKTLVMGVLISVEDLINEVQVGTADSIVKCPIEHKGKKYYLVLSAKYILSLSQKMIESEDLKMEKIFRVRESLLQSWIHTISSYNSRIGTASFQ